MSIESGLYIVVNKANGHNIGRYPVEDRSLLPKRVMVLPQGVQAPMWIIEKKPDSNYTMKAGGAPASTQNSLLFVSLIDGIPPPAASWCITATPQHGENTYIIELDDKSAGWVVPDTNPDGGDLVQVQVKPLISTKSMPPQYPATELFTLIRIDRE
ncbi:hypothetical protein FRB94_008554 [Tulasnella sp. JGI-2019a]|nr:hypothetical protein FRB94_008554 [Tulasnella sp. JGI-2019a]KAG9010625.1 hypothetical protein FRB93_003893 [Tulasnella sp. JGI-2019a]KAG9027027.1 hypothetical protein FRB95_008192 [Tulasnella sp. JGI-2019a]